MLTAKEIIMKRQRIGIEMFSLLKWAIDYGQLDGNLEEAARKLITQWESIA